MHRALERRRREREEALQKATRYALTLKETLGPLTAVLCGSFARGDFNLGSDIDVVIICDALPSHPLKRMEVLYACVDGGIEPKGYTRKEFLGLLRKGHPTAVDALAEGLVLCDDGYWQGLRQAQIS